MRNTLTQRLTRTFGAIVAAFLLLGLMGSAEAQAVYKDPAPTITSIPGLQPTVSQSVLMPKEIVAIGGNAYNKSGGPITTGNTGQNSRVAYGCPGAAYDPQVVYANANNDTPGANNITVRAAIELAGGTVYPILFRGSRTLVLEPGATVVSDPIGLLLPASTVFYVRTFVTVATAGMTWSENVFSTGSNAVEGTPGTDLTLTGTIANASAGNLTSGVYGPMAILGTFVGGRKPSVAIIGDSINQGIADIQNTPTLSGAAWQYPGHVARAIGNAYGYINMAQNGEPTSLLQPYRRLMLAGCSHAIEDYGINDIYLSSATLATLQASKTALWQSLSDSGLKVFSCTLLPQTTSTDTWLTTANQTVKNKEAIRTGYNDWLRSRTALNSPLTGYFETADLAETTRNSGIWRISTPPSQITNTANTFVSNTNFNLTVNGTLPSDGSLNGWTLYVTGGTGVGSSIVIAFISAGVLHGNNPGFTGITLDATSVYSIQVKPYTGDGIHPNGNSTYLIAPAVDITKIRL